MDTATTPETTITQIAIPPCPLCGAPAMRDTFATARICCSARHTVHLAWLRQQARDPDRVPREPKDLYDGVCDWSGLRHEFDIPRGALRALGDRFAKIGKRAAKLGVTAPSFEVTGYFPREWKGEDGVTHVTEIACVTVSGEAPRIHGWSFVARIDHLEDGNLLAACDRSIEIPARYRTAPCVCEHCNLKRRRIATYLLRSDDGAWKQVGANCLSDFLGHAKPESIAALAEFWSDALTACDDLSDIDEDGSSGGAGGRRDDGYNMTEFMVRVAQAIRLFGWRSRAKADELCKSSTCSDALDMLSPPRGYPSPPKPEQIDRDRAAAAIEWARSLPEDCDDYLWNLRTAAHRDYVTPLTFGLMASALPAYDRSLAKRAAKKPSEWIGVVKVKGDKRYKAPTFRLTVDRVIDLESQWGVTHVHLMHDADGNAVTWKSSTVALEQGSAYDVTGTVEAHEVYRPRDAAPDFPGVKQTKMSRCKAVLVREEPAAA